jgi:hypothetical protein
MFYLRAIFDLTNTGSANLSLILPSKLLNLHPRTQTKSDMRAIEASHVTKK